jgi:hypothetical protein
MKLTKIISAPFRGIRRAGRFVNDHKYTALLVVGGIINAATEKPASAAMITQQDVLGGTSVKETYLNDDNGAVYNSWQANSVTELVNAVYALPHNQSTYSSAKEMFDTAVGKNFGPLSEIEDGWNVAHDGSAVVVKNNGGFPGFDYDEWVSTNANASRDSASVEFDFSNVLAGYEITKAPAVSAEMGVGKENAFTSYSAPGNKYNVPEPATTALLAVGGVLLLRRRKD